MYNTNPNLCLSCKVSLLLHSGLLRGNDARNLLTKFQQPQFDSQIEWLHKMMPETVVDAMADDRQNASHIIEISSAT